MNDTRQEERALIAETCERLFADHLDAEVFCAAEAGTWPDVLWNAIAQAGLDRILVPEGHGGSGLGWEDAQVVLHAAGRHGLPVPLAETMAAGWLLAQAGLDVPDGVLTLADDVERVPWGADAGHAVLADADGVQCVPVADLQVRRDRNIGRDARDAYGGAEDSATALNFPIRLAGALARSCQMAGAVEAVLDLCVGYVNDRVQFGRPIGKLQAIQQQLAVVAGEVAAAQTAARAACRAVDGAGLSPDGLHAVAVAKIRTGEAAGKAAAVAHQVHGAIGFTEEYSLHHLTRRLWSWRSEFGTENKWSQVLGRIVAARGADSLWPDLTARG